MKWSRAGVPCIRDEFLQAETGEESACDSSFARSFETSACATEEEIEERGDDTKLVRDDEQHLLLLFQ